MPTFALGNYYRIRERCPVQVLRCFSPTEPSRFSLSLPPLDDEGIWSGMVLVVADGTYMGAAVKGFRKAQPADATGSAKEFYIATQDQDGHDVQASGKLVAIPCREDIELQTGYYEGVDFEEGTALTVGDDGVMVPADQQGMLVIARISAVGGLDSGAFPSASKSRSVHVEDASVIQVITEQSGDLFDLPPGFLLDEFGFPLLDEFNNPIIAL